MVYFKTPHLFQVSLKETYSIAVVALEDSSAVWLVKSAARELDPWTMLQGSGVQTLRTVENPHVTWNRPSVLYIYTSATLSDSTNFGLGSAVLFTTEKISKHKWTCIIPQTTCYLSKVNWSFITVNLEEDQH